MKLTMITNWNGHKVAVESHLDTHEDRKKSCILQTQEIVYTIMHFIPTPANILLHMEYFNIED